MRPVFDSVRIVRAWLDEITELAVARCWAEWRTSPSTRLYLWYERSRPGTWGRFAIAPHMPKGAAWEIATGGIFSSMTRDQLRDHIRAAVSGISVLNPDLDATPPKAELHQGGEPTKSEPAKPTPEPAPSQPDTVVMICEHPTRQAALEF